MSAKVPVHPLAGINEGQAALRREVRDGFAAVSARLDVLAGKVETRHAEILELLSQLGTKNPGAS
ncbi:hypothetical protein [Streptomyces sioyaensis]|uniref:hypothetical protein n=1 Tax=Streptomyces sioyaensis TaxID=67364 RepID=UPI003D740860